jgi:hypothetical protein
MPSNVVQRNLKRKRAMQRNSAVGKTNRKKANARIKRKRQAIRSVGSSPARKRSLVSVALATVLAISPSLRKAVAAGHPGPPPNPASQAGAKKHNASVYHQRSLKTSKDGFSQLRVVQRVTPRGPVLFFEKVIDNKKVSKPLKVGVAKGIKISQDTLLKLGVRSPGLKDNIDWGNTDFGLIFVSGKNLVEAHRRGSKDATRYSVGQKIANSAIDASYMEANYLTAKPAGRIGISKLEKTLGLDLRGLSTEMGITSSGGGRATADVKLVYSIGNAKIGVGAANLGSGKPRMAGFIVIGL